MSDLQGKFPFQQAYAYDKKFQQQIQNHINQQGSVIDSHLWSKELHGTTLLVLCLLVTLIFIPVTTIIGANLQGKFAGFSTSAANATVMGTLQTIAGPDPAAHPQLNPATFQPVTPLKPD